MCHQTVRLVAEALERASIPTVVVGTMRTPLKGLPRILISRYDRGRNFGAASDATEHRALAREALSLFDALEPTLIDHKERATAP